MPIPLDEVRRLNYDHHRRMTNLHAEQVTSGEQTSIVDDDASYRALLHAVPVLPSVQRALELGSASGGQWPLLHELMPAAKLVGIDLYEPLVVAAQKAGLPIYIGMVEDMRVFADGDFDFICSRHVMEHLGDVDAGIHEIDRILQPGGFTAHVTPDLPLDDEPAHLNRWKKDQWCDVWTKHGFWVVRAERCSFNNGETHIVLRKP